MLRRNGKLINLLYLYINFEYIREMFSYKKIFFNHGCLAHYSVKYRSYTPKIIVMNDLDTYIVMIQQEGLTVLWLTRLKLPWFVVLVEKGAD